MIFKNKSWLLYMVVFLLPMYTKLNNVLLVVFILINIAEIFFNRKKINILTLFINGWPVFAFFGLAMLASFRSLDLQSVKFLENHWSLLLLPFVILQDKQVYSKKRREIFLSLLLGSLVTLAICNINYTVNMLSNRVNFYEWFNLDNFDHEFTEVADTHPAYLGLFIVTSILFLIQDKKLTMPLKLLLIVFLFVGLFQLISTMALLLFLLFFIYVIIHNTKKLKLEVPIIFVGLLACIIVFFFNGSNHMGGKMYFVDTILDEKRIERWDVSYEIFRENPFIGVGYKKIDEIRQEKYLKGDYSLAANNDLNAHNQFLEYLSIDGAVGGFVYAISLGFLFFLSIERKDHLFTFVFFAFILANLTESMMVRIKGIEYYAIFATLFLCSRKEILKYKPMYVEKD